MSAAEYRVVHFVPNPIAGAQVAVAALVRVGCSVKVVRPESTPGAECLGSLRAATLLHAVRPFLERLEDFSRLPAELGPLFVLGQIQQLPATDSEPLAALERLLFPTVARAPQVRRPRRATQGRAWLVRNGVSDTAIRRRFRPADLGLDAHAEPITHFARGASGVLLMEPIVSMHSHSELLSSVDSIATRLRATDHVLGEARYGDERRFIAYVLPGNSGEAVRLARDAIRFANASVIDCSSHDQAAAFTAQINRLVDPLPVH